MSRKAHSFWMKEAVLVAERARDARAVPGGAIITCHDRIIGKGYNQRETLNDPTAHAEIIAITAAASTLANWRLDECTIYVTKEPCPMCAGAIINARIEMLVFGAYDEKKGACGSLYQLCADRRLDSKTAVKGGVMQEDCANMIQNFFIDLRKKEFPVQFFERFYLNHIF